MFTGIITNLGQIKNLTKKTNQDLKITIQLENKFQNNRPLDIGSSIACNGICLTLINKISENNFLNLDFEVSSETISKTTISNWKIGQKINLEFSLRMGDEFGGHMVSGHVDATSKIKAIKKIDTSHQFIFSIPKNLEKFICPKGSITLDGIALTVNDVDHDEFSVNIIPHTFENTNLQDAKVGDEVNLEIDVIARYISKLLKTN